MDQNIWLSESDLAERGYSKILKVIDSKCDASEGGYSKALTQQNVEEHLESIGMTKENATHVYVAFRNEQEFSSWKDSLKDWDVIINRLAI